MAVGLINQLCEDKIYPVGRYIMCSKHDYKDFIMDLQKINRDISFYIDEPMKNHTSLRIGGNADILLVPHDVMQLAQIIQLSKQHGIPYFVMGNGSNLLVSDKGIRGLTIKTHNAIQHVNVNKNYITAGCGVLLSKLSNIALKNGLTGLEFASGIPGTLGGAIVMNAGAYGGEMKDVVVETKYIDEDGTIKTIKGEEHKFGYRTSIFQGTQKIVVESTLKLDFGDMVDIKNKMDDLNTRRREKQPLDMPSAGSTFRRPEGYYAGKLIQDSGLKGFRIGGAQVSEKHCGFIVNTGNATAKDVLDLVQHIQATVKEKFNVELHTEIKFVGER